ncbi:MAG: 16S rRNA (uracil(1498)-N(3))-methyltransferase [Flavobacteriaceae bacterium]|nr:16S rRNA (uracil(1498)-N(3))-methyltransferase [Flavobacteriaceae bacterium]|tara:strand:+ start:39673 stop:40377 length:705 start_codon:yes stop_codon:yes gene_type:complete
MQLFYNPELDSSAKEVTFDKIESRHIVKVLRKKMGDVLSITNGQGSLFEAEIIVAGEKKCVASIKSSVTKEKGWNYHLHMAIAPTKSLDRLEWFLEKATEIGVDEITPIFCSNSERRVVKMERLQKIVVSASKQSLKYHFPKLNKAITFKEFLNDDLDGEKLIAHCYDRKKTPLKDINVPDKTTILIGPEGDFSEQEVDRAISKGFTAISLGTSRLRTETAGIAAVHSVSLLNQ